LDEPFAAVDPVTVQGIQQTIGDLQAEGISILITDHAAREILQIVDRCYVIARGQVLAHGTASEIRTSEAVRKEYLGNLEIGPERSVKTRDEELAETEQRNRQAHRQDSSRRAG